MYDAQDQASMPVHRSYKQTSVGVRCTSMVVRKQPLPSDPGRHTGLLINGPGGAK